MAKVECPTHKNQCPTHEIELLNFHHGVPNLQMSGALTFMSGTPILVRAALTFMSGALVFMSRTLISVSVAFTFVRVGHSFIT